VALRKAVEETEARILPLREVVLPAVKIPVVTGVLLTKMNNTRVKIFNSENQKRRITLIRLFLLPVKKFCAVWKW
jgi:hypothetical protein